MGKLGGKVIRLETLLAKRRLGHPPLVIHVEDADGRLTDPRPGAPVPPPPPGAIHIVITTRPDGPQ